MRPKDFTITQFLCKTQTDSSNKTIFFQNVNFNKDSHSSSLNAKKSLSRNGRGRFSMLFWSLFFFLMESCCLIKFLQIFDSKGTVSNALCSHLCICSQFCRALTDWTFLVIKSLEILQPCSKQKSIMSVNTGGSRCWDFNSKSSMPSLCNNQRKICYI